MSTSIPTKTGLRILHTSDWHLGKRLYNQSRYDEFAEFLAWLLENIDRHEVDVLIVAGDIFDTMTPSNKAQELYYGFLGQVAKSACRHVIITAGNHDSPTFLDAPKMILRSLNVQVIGSACDDIYDEVITLHHGEHAEAIIIAAPYLRDKDVRNSGSFDELSTKEYDTAQGIAQHYAALSAHAKTLQDKIKQKQHQSVPIIATGHLFAIGSIISSKDDGMRELYVGTLGQISASIFEPCIDYVALGHIHAPQKVANQEHIRYCGSPIAMGFGEANKTKQVLIVDFDGTSPSIHPLAVPVFQELVSISGDWQTIETTLKTLITKQTSIWTEIIYTGDTLEPELAKKIHALLDDSLVLALNINNKTQYQHSLNQTHQGEKLTNLSQMQVFDKLLARHEIHTDEMKILKTAYQTVINTLNEEDKHAL